MRICMVCKQEIEDERAELIPDTRLCSRHGREIEKFGGEFKMQVSQERTSKQGSLKLNYGGISTRRVRNHLAMEQLQVEFDRQQFEQD